MGSGLLQASSPTPGSIPRAPRPVGVGDKELEPQDPLPQDPKLWRRGGQVEPTHIWQQLPVALAGWY